ncbi:helix-turn-helix domain-containing protein [Paraburkholderia sp. C35]|uniref:transcriptional regulator n=1 Tax=Paraburkholderia sp. C35 TaxID=2126993 RepID=UPI000D69CB72|nr:helix-turn-helix domain-containing protein [Paraburkholderia sp. C35]
MKLSDYLSKHKISQTTFAAQLGVSQGLVYQWLTGKRPVAAEQCPKIEELTGGEVRCEELNDRVDWAFVRASGEKVT